MGRHSLGDERVFWRSVSLFILKWTLVAGLPALAIWGVFRLVSQPEVSTRDEPEAVATSPSPEATPSPEASPSPEITSPSPSPSPLPTVTKGRVQVLNGTAKEGLANKAADRLRADGYEIVAVARASRSYEATTVFYQPGHQALADQIARFLGASEVKPAPDNLDRDIPITVVVGTDFN